MPLWIEKLFEAKIPADTLKKRAQRAQEKLGTNVPNHPTQQEDSGIEENFVDSKSVITDRAASSLKPTASAVSRGSKT